MAGETGLRINGIFALLLFVSLATGVVAWWPGIARRARGLAVVDSHAAVGLWTLLPLLVWSLSGIELAYPAPFIAAVRAVLPTTSTPPPVSSWKPGDALVPIDPLIARSIAASPANALETDIAYPTAAGEVVSIARIGLASLTDQDYFDPRTGSALGHHPGRRPGDAFVSLLATLHFGSLANGTRADTAVKIAWSAIGLAPATLAVTGAAFYLRRLQRRRLHRLA